MTKFKVLFTLLCIATVSVIGWNVWVYTVTYAGQSRIATPGTIYDRLQWLTGLYYRVKPLEEVPDEYWNLTDPDEYTLIAINNPSKWVCVNQTEITFHEQIPDRIFNFNYEDKYYSAAVVWVDNFEVPDERAQQLLNLGSVGVLSISWATLGVWIQRNKRK